MRVFKYPLSIEKYLLINRINKGMCKKVQKNFKKVLTL